MNAAAAPVPVSLYPQMTPQNSLDHNGNLKANPLAELLAEISQAGLEGSLRLSHGDGKAILYFRDGDVVYGVSNAREHRLLHILSDLGKIDPTKLAGLPKCANDVELATMLVREGVVSKVEVDAAIANQIERIVVSAVSWPDGEWHYSPLVRSREGLAFMVNVPRILVDYGRVLPMNSVLSRFRSMEERFERIAEANGGLQFQSHEDYVLQRFTAGARSIQDLTLECGLPENGFLQALYVLWLGGSLRRFDWNAAFSENRINAIRSARMTVVKQAQKPVVEIKTEPVEPVAPPAAEPVERAPAAAPQQPVVEMTLDEYLERSETGKTHYDILGVDPKSAVAAIKASYFGLAKLFHPDRFHRESADTLLRVQAAFSKVQIAYDTLKSADTRETYDFKVRKELEMREKLKAQGIETTEEKIDSKTEQGLENFEAGLSLLMDEEYDRAVPFLGRAAHYNPDNALYRAYFGKALSYDSKQRHRAENEMQAAIKLDPANPKIRLMLVEFFMEHNMIKRAEGELKRFLELVPGNEEARTLLNRIRAQMPAQQGL